MYNTDIPKIFDQKYYDDHYFSDLQGKKFRSTDGNEQRWGYKNPTGEWLGCGPIVKAWKDIFNLSKCNTEHGKCKILDIGCGRGQFVTYLRDVDIEAWGFDFSEWAVENRYPRCKKEWIIVHDAIQRWPYGDNAFDFVIALDFFEHVYLEDIDFVLEEIYRVSKKWIFLQIAIIGGGSGFSIHENGYIIKKGESVPIELEGMAVAGHVTVQSRDFWVEKLKNIELKNKSKGGNWRFREDLVQEFIRRTPSDIISNWTKNLLLVLEKVD